MIRMLAIQISTVVWYSGDLKSDHSKYGNIQNLDFIMSDFKWSDIWILVRYSDAQYHGTGHLSSAQFEKRSS